MRKDNPHTRTNHMKSSITKLLALLGALAIAGGLAWAEDTDKCPGKKKDCEKKDEAALLAGCGKCKKEGECDKDKKEGEKKDEAALLA